jgi:hypothetical protein
MRVREEKIRLFRRKIFQIIKQIINIRVHYRKFSNASVSANPGARLHSCIKAEALSHGELLENGVIR